MGKINQKIDEFDKKIKENALEVQGILKKLNEIDEF